VYKKYNVSTKKLEKFLLSPQNTSFSQIESILLSLEWQLREGKGSHKVFIKKGQTRLIFSIHNKDCPAYQKHNAADKISSSLQNEK